MMSPHLALTLAELKSGLDQHFDNWVIDEYLGQARVVVGVYSKKGVSIQDLAAFTKAINDKRLLGFAIEIRTMGPAESFVFRRQYRCHTGGSLR